MAGVTGQQSGGHNRRSAEAHRLSGSFRGDRHAGDRRENVPRAPGVIPPAPNGLTGASRRLWRAQANAETLHLRSDDGSFEGRKRISDFTGRSDRSVAVVFEDAPMDKTYSLDVIDAGGKAHAMFAKIPYGDLRNSKQRFEA